jgi:hypothetical protein
MEWMLNLTCKTKKGDTTNDMWTIMGEEPW